MKIHIALALAVTLTTGNVTAEAKKGEFLNHCAQGLSEGKMMETDCSINWQDPASKKTYCFSSEAEKSEWSKDVTGNRSKAQANFAKLGKNHGEGTHSNSEHGHDEHEHETRKDKGM